MHDSNVNMLKNRIDEYLIRAGYTMNSTCRLSIRQGHPCPLPSEVLLGWQSRSILSNH